jgi:hypothetical protein
MSEMVDAILRQFEYNKSKRTNWESQWSEVADYFLPNQSGNWSLSGMDNELTTGQKKGELIYNSKPVLDLAMFVGIADGLLTPVNKKWHTLKPKDKSLLKDKRVMDWYYEVNEILFDYRYNPGSNFAEQNNMRWEQMGAYGTGLLFIDYDKEETLRYKCINLKNVTLGQNHQGIVNRVDRVLHLSLLDIVSEFGKGGLPETLLFELNDVESANKKHMVLHTVMPAEKKEGFSSYYILVKDRLLLSEGKYASFPYSVSRYNTSPDEVFGRGLAMQCMSDVLNLNKYQNDINLALDGSIKPTVLTQDDSIADNGVIDMAPNSVIVGGLDHNGNPKMVPFRDGVRVDWVAAEIDRLESRIDETFLITLFQIMIENPRMTAYEVMTRAQEKSMLLTPLLVRQQNQSLNPLIKRELSILYEAGLLPDMPVEVENIFNVTFQSPVNDMQDSESLSNINKVMQTILPLIQNNPDALNIVDLHKLVKMAFIDGNIPSTILKSDKQVEQETEARAKQEQEANFAEQAISTSEVLKNLKGVENV